MLNVKDVFAAWLDKTVAAESEGARMKTPPIVSAQEWEDSPEGYPQTKPYEWWDWHDEYGKHEPSRWFGDPDPSDPDDQRPEA